MKRFAYVRSCLIRTSRAGLLSSVLKRCVAVALAYNTCVHIHTHTHTTLACMYQYRCTCCFRCDSLICRGGCEAVLLS